MRNAEDCNFKLQFERKRAHQLNVHKLKLTGVT